MLVDQERKEDGNGRGQGGYRGGQIEHFLERYFE